MRNIHTKLLEDCHYICETPISTVLLNKNAATPWMILVPESQESEFLLFEPSFQQSLLKQSQLIAGYLINTFPGKKLNFADIGNIVPQCHLHIILRNEEDPCWPLPVWGHLDTHHRYDDAMLAGIKDQITDLLA